MKKAPSGKRRGLLGVIWLIGYLLVPLGVVRGVKPLPGRASEEATTL